MEGLKGKCLVRKARGTDGKMYVIIAGTFIPSEPLETFSDRDEMWAVEFLVADVIKFEGHADTNGFPGGPEEFLEGKHHDPRYWARKPA